MKKKIIGGIVIAGMIGYGLSTGVLGQRETSEEGIKGDVAAKRVNVGVAALTDIRAEISTTGVIVAEETSTIYASSSAEVLDVTVEVGDRVSKGDILLVLDDETKTNIQRELDQLDLQIETARLAVNQLRTGSSQNITNAELNVSSKENSLVEVDESIRQLQVNLDVAKTDLANVQNQYDVIDSLVSQGLESQTTLDDRAKALTLSKDQVVNLENTLQTLTSNRELAVRQLDSAIYDLQVLTGEVEDKTKSENIAMKENDIASLEIRRLALVEQLEEAETQILATMDGVIATVNIDASQYTSPSAPLFTIISDDRLVVEAEVSPYYAAQLMEGLKADVTFNGATTVETTGGITTVSPVAVQKTSGISGAGTTAIPVEITLDQTEGLKQGLVVDLKIITESVEGVVGVPILATYSEDEENYVFVVDEKGILEKRVVEEGISDSTSIEVKGVEVGEIVVTNPTQLLTDGMAVSYVDVGEVQ